MCIVLTGEENSSKAWSAKLTDFGLAAEITENSRNQMADM